MSHQTWSTAERALLDSLDSPRGVQSFLDALPYSPDVTFRSPRQVMRDLCANCMEGALFAAAALEHQVYVPVIVNLRAVRDDDHVLAWFRRNGRIGAIAKSNFSGLRWRSPIFASLRELALSYFDHFFNVDRELTMRGWTRPLDLIHSVFQDWRTREFNLDDIADHLDALPWTLVFEGDDAWLPGVDDRLYTTGLEGAHPRALYDPSAHK
jgi:hypothetical protein